MIKKMIILGVLLMISIPAFAQRADTSWVRRYGSDISANAMAVDCSGNVYVTGSAYATIKYYPNGDTAWVRGFAAVVTYAITLDDSGYVYVAGEITEGSFPLINSSYETIKYKPNGDTVWVRKYHEGTYNRALAIVVDASYNVYVTGWSDSLGTSNTNEDYATVKYSPSGTQLWAKRYNGPGSFHDVANAIAVDDSGNVCVTGWSARSGTSPFNYDIATIKYDASGNELWVKRYYGSGTYDDRGYDIATGDSGYIYVTGSVYNYSNDDFVTIKYKSNGDLVWDKTYNGTGSGSDKAKALALDADGNIIVTGYSVGSSTYKDFATIKYKPNGDTAWVRRYDDATYHYDDLAQDVAVDVYNNVYVTGWSAENSAYPFNYDYVTMKYDASGKQRWVKKYNGPGNNDDQTSAIAVDTFSNATGNIYVTGQSWASNFQYATIKYYQSLCGDVNCDSMVTVSDAVYLSNYLFRGGPQPCPTLIAGDVNCDGVVNATDLVYISSYLFQGGAPPCDPDRDGQEECHRP